jgi:hypothetical protein
MDWSAVSYSAVLIASRTGDGRCKDRTGIDVLVRDSSGAVLAKDYVEIGHWTRHDELVMVFPGVAVRFPSSPFADAFASFACGL